MVNKNYETNYDVFNSFLVREAAYSSEEEFPCIKSCNEIPNKIITFSKAMSPKCKDYDSWVCFYELDFAFMRIWRQPRRYLNKLKKFNGVISPDFSVYANMPIVMQKYHIYMGRAIATWLKENGVKVIPNVRLGDERTYDFALEGLYKNDVIAIGTVGSYKRLKERNLLISAIKKTLETLEPTDAIIYGPMPKEINKSDYPKTQFHVYESGTFNYMRVKKRG